MRIPSLENERVKLTLLDLSNYKHLSEIAQQVNLVQYSPSKIDTVDDLKAYVQNAVECYYQKTAMPFIIFDKQHIVYKKLLVFLRSNCRNLLFRQHSHKGDYFHKCLNDF